MITRFQLGGAVNEEQKAFTAFLIKITNAKDEKDFEDKVSKLSPEQINKLYKQFKSMSDQTIKAKLGAKLDYIMQLNGKCPEGTEKYLAGGCIKCKKKAQGSTIDLIKDQMKCGGKMKKRIRKKKNGDVIKKLGPGDSTSAGTAKPNKKQSKAMK